MVDFLGGVPSKWKLFFQKFGLAGSPVTEPSSGNKDDPFHGSCSVFLFLFVSVLLLCGWELFFSSLMKINLTGKAYASTVSIKAIFPWISILRGPPNYSFQCLPIKLRKSLLSGMWVLPLLLQIKVK